MNILFLAIFIAGFMVRVAGVYPGYNPYHPDEGKAGYSSAWYMFLNHTLNLPHYNYPALIPTTELIFFVLFFIPILWSKLLLLRPDLVLSNLHHLPFIFQEYIVGREDTLIMYLSRYLTVLFSVLTMFLTYLAGRRLFAPRLVSVLALAVLAVNLRAVTGSQLDLPDTYASFYLMLAIWVILKLKSRFTLRWYLLSGVAIGLSVSTKLQFFSLLPFALVHLNNVWGKKSWQQRISFLFSPGVWLAVLSLLITLAMVNIGPLTHFKEFSETIFYEAQRYGVGSNRLSTISLVFFYKIVLTPLVLFASVLGVLVGLRRNTFPTILILSVIVPYLWYIFYLTEGWFFPRNFVSIIPFFALLAGRGLFGVWELLGLSRSKNRWFFKEKARVVIFACIVAIVLFESAKDSLVHTLYWSKPWSLVSMRACIDQRVSPGKVVGSHPWDKYILFSLPETDVRKKLEFVALDPESFYSAAELREEKADYALIGLDVLSYANSDWWMRMKGVNLWEKPNNISLNVFGSLAAGELFKNALCSEVKPWQATDNNYVFARVPENIDFQGKILTTYQIDDEKQLTEWEKVDGSLGAGDNLVWDAEGGLNNSGALQIKGERTIYPVIRWISPTFRVQENTAYKAEGWLRAEASLSAKQRDGFLRLDFYKESPGAWDEGTLGVAAHVSGRYFGSGEWKKYEVAGIAPPGAKLATVSFQVSNPVVTGFWLDNLSVYGDEDKTVKIERQAGEREAVVDIDVLVPNLGGGF